MPGITLNVPVRILIDLTLLGALVFGGDDTKVSSSFVIRVVADNEMSYNDPDRTKLTWMSADVCLYPIRASKKIILLELNLKDILKLRALNNFT